ncbi:MAG: DUF4271 domain-containing protein [Bacteroidales bacterium]|nr:DUF4271 domain-containing protein [Bacteroidales bacterium]
MNMTVQNIGEPLAVDILRAEWIFALLMIPVLLYLFVSLYEKYSLIRIVRIVFSNKFAHTTYRNLTPGTQVFQMLLGLLSLISIASFMLFTELHFDIIFYGLDPPMLWLFNLGLASLAISFRYIINHTIAAVTRTKNAFREYFFNISRSYKLIGILLMILNFFISYLVSVPDRYLIISAFIFIAILLVFRFIRLVYVFIINRLSLSYMILYLCALEILPVLLLIKYLNGLEH